MNSGSGGSSQPTQQTTQQTSIPSYVQPYVENVLGRTAALTDINQNPYTPYSGQQVAGFSDLQNQAFSGIQNQQVAPQLGQATGMATGATQGAMGTAGTALGYGQQAAGAGQNYQNMATDPNSVQAYMNPYIQQSLAPQLAMLGQQQSIASQGINAKAVGAGAFGGNRATLAQGLNAQNYDLARQQAIGQGYDTAFKQAQQAQQFGSTLGLQGLQTGLQGVAGAQNAYGLGIQGANTVGQLGQNQYNQQMGINQAQLAAGNQQQALNQAQLNVPYQQYLDNLNYPYKQLAFQQGMFSGLPMSQSAQTMYQQQPNTGQQALGLGLGALGAYKAFS